MSTGWKFKRVAGGLVLCAATLCPGIVSPANAASAQTHKKAKKPPAPLPPLPNGPTGPVPPIPLDSMSPVPPQVSYQNSQLTIVAPNSTLGDILRAVHKQTGAEIDVPAATERVVTHLGPGPAREVVAELLNGSRFNYVLLGSPADDSSLTRVLLVAKTGADTAAAQQQPASKPQPPPEAEASEAAAAEETDAAADEAAAEAEQAAPPPDQQPGVKSPQEMLQEMQQRQLQLQQQQIPGQPPVPGSGIPPRTPPDQQPQQQ